MAGKGRNQRSHSPSAKTRAPDLSKFYRYKLPNLTPDEYDYAVLLKRTGQKTISLDRIVESITWADEESVLTGTLTLRRPGDANDLSINRGDIIILRALWRDRAYELWRMRCEIPEVAVETGTITVDLADDLIMLRRSERAWSFRRRKHRRGWNAVEITKVVAKKCGVRVGRIARAKHKMPKLVRRKATGLSILIAAWSEERKSSGRKFIIRMTNGKLEILPYKRNSLLYIFNTQIENALISQGGSSNPVTAIVVKGKLGKGHNKKSFTRTVIDRKAARRMGYRSKVLKVGHVDSVHEGVVKGRRELAKQLRVKRTCQITVPCVPFIRRGDGCRVVIPSDNFTGKQSYVYVTTVTHSIAGDSRTTDIEVTMDDPFLKDQKQREAEARKKKREQRNKEKKK